MRALICLLVSVPLVGCISGDVETSSSSQAVTTYNSLTYNRLAGNRLAGNRLAGNRLAGNRLAGNRLTLNANSDDLIETADGRDVLTYLISCALPEGTTLTGTDSEGNTYEFDGQLGLAPHWLDAPLDGVEEGWVSACMFSRVNANDVAVAISLRGPTRALDTTADERAGWPAEEGAFYGDLFVPVDQPLAWYACRGRDSAEAVADERDCAVPDPANPGYTVCNFIYAGDCHGSWEPLERGACMHSPRGYYTDCGTSTTRGRNGWGDRNDGVGRRDGNDVEHGGVYRQVITVYVQ